MDETDKDKLDKVVPRLLQNIIIIIAVLGIIGGILSFYARIVKPLL